MSNQDDHEPRGPRRQGLAGSQVGPYEVQELLGTGGFASVYRAHDPRLRSDVALKVLADNHALNADIRERFVSEGHLLRRIDNPAGLQVYDIGETEQGNPFLVLELADQGDFEGRVTQRRASGWMPGPDDVRALVTTLADALDAFHDHDVVHRDVKPSNLLIGSTRRKVDRGQCSVIEPNERLLLADLGLAKDLAAASGLTVSGGSAGFAAREQLEPGSVIDARADVFAASAAVAWLISGRTPREGSAWESFSEATFAPLIPVLQTGLAPNRDDRPSTIRSWADALLVALDEAASAAAPPTGVHPSATPPMPNPISMQPPMPEPSQQVATTPATTPATTTAAAVPDGRSVPVVPVLASIAAVIILGLGALFVLTRGPDITVLDDGRSQVATTSDDASVAIIGPGTPQVGVTARYEIRLTGIESWTLIGPDGTRHDNVGAIDVRASSPGSAAVKLTALTASGEAIEAELPLNIVAP